MQATNSQRILFKKSCQNLHITSFDGFPFHLTTYIFSAALHDIWSGTGPKFPGLHDCQCDQCHGFQSGTHLVSGMYSTNPFDQWFASRKLWIGCTFIFQSLIFSIYILIMIWLDHSKCELKRVVFNLMLRLSENYKYECIYRTRAFITRSLYLFYPIFHCGLCLREVYIAERLVITWIFFI